MRNRPLKFLLLMMMVSLLTQAQEKKVVKGDNRTSMKKEAQATPARPMVTFIELGSVNCIPCKAMQPVMKAIDENYGDQIKIIFYDVWKEEQAHFAKQYKIRVIPTQVFLDADGKELMRHEGFFPEKEIDVFLQKKGLKPKSTVKG